MKDRPDCIRPAGSSSVTRWPRPGRLALLAPRSRRMPCPRPWRRWAGHLDEMSRCPSIVAVLVETRDRDVEPDLSVFGLVGPNRGSDASQADFVLRFLFLCHKHLSFFVVGVSCSSKSHSLRDCYVPMLIIRTQSRTDGCLSQNQNTHRHSPHFGSDDAFDPHQPLWKMQIYESGLATTLGTTTWSTL